jgi:hypothetical protein
MLAALAPKILEAHAALADFEGALPDITAAALAVAQRLTAFPAGEGSGP